eukprot:EG_transcript_47566
MAMRQQANSVDSGGQGGWPDAMDLRRSFSRMALFSSTSWAQVRRSTASKNRRRSVYLSTLFRLSSSSLVTVALVAVNCFQLSMDFCIVVGAFSLAAGRIDCV